MENQYDLVVAHGKNWRKYPSKGDTRIHLSIESKLIALALVELMKKGVARRAIVSTGRTAGPAWPSEAREIRDYALKHGYAELAQQIELEEISIDTAGNAEEIKRMLGANKKEVLLLSISFHFPRAAKLYQNYGITTASIDAETVLTGTSPEMDRFLRVYHNSPRYLFEKFKEKAILNPFLYFDPKGEKLRHLTSIIRNG